MLRGGCCKGARKPNGWRWIHLAIAKAHRRGELVTLTLVENVLGSEPRLLAREKELNDAHKREWGPLGMREGSTGG